MHFTPVLLKTMHGIRGMNKICQTDCKWDIYANLGAITPFLPSHKTPACDAYNRGVRVCTCVCMYVQKFVLQVIERNISVCVCVCV